MARGKNKGKAKTPYGGPSNDSQKSQKERVADLIQSQRDKEQAQLLSDERIAARLQELEKQIEESKAELESKKAELDMEYAEKEEELRKSVAGQQAELDARAEILDQQKADQDEREKELEDVERLAARRCEAAAEKETERIKADERMIREKEKEAVYAEWEADKVQKRKELEKYIRAQRRKADTELEKAHAERMEAEEKKLEKIREADAVIEERRAELTKEYEQKAGEFAAKKLEYERKLEELTEQQEELDADSQYVRELKKKYSRYSENEVWKLQQIKEHYEIQIKAYTERIQELNEKTARMESRLLDDDGQSLLVRIDELEEKLAEAVRRSDELANMPSQEEIERLRAGAVELEQVKIVLDDEKQKRHEAEAKISAYAMSARELENARITAAALESLNNQMQLKLKYISDQYKTVQESKFKVLLDIDKEIAGQELFNPRGFHGTLSELCEYVRNYGAVKKGLYYSIDTVRVFFASLAASEKISRLLILQGLSGTGKSSLPRLVAEALGAECRFVAVQPSWRDDRELLGYDNDFTNRFKETAFTKFLYEASALPNRRKMYMIVLDEMNLARIEYYFADFLSVLEKPDQAEWIIPLVSGYSEPDEDQKPRYLDYSNEAANLCVTNNVWFVGTANNDDSTSLITDKVYDRAQVLDMDRREEVFQGKQVSRISMDLDELSTLFAQARTEKNRLTDDDWKKIMMVDEYLKEMDITFGNRIMNQMDDFVPAYTACGGTKEEAVDYLLTHKILRKLDERYEPYLQERLEDLEQGLNDIYGEGRFRQSIEKIRRLIEKMAG